MTMKIKLWPGSKLFDFKMTIRFKDVLNVLLLSKKSMIKKRKNNVCSNYKKRQRMLCL